MTYKLEIEDNSELQEVFPEVAIFQDIVKAKDYVDFRSEEKLKWKKSGKGFEATDTKKVVYKIEKQ